MKNRRYRLCSHQECIENGQFLYDPSQQSEVHDRHQSEPAKLDKMCQKFKEIANSMHLAYVQHIEKEIIETMEKLVYKMFQKSANIFTILKNHAFMPKSPLQFGYQEIKSFLSGDYQPLNRQAKKTFEEISFRYRPIFLKWQRQINKLTDYIESSVVNHEISKELKQEQFSDNQQSYKERPNFTHKTRNKAKKISKLRKKAEDMIYNKKKKEEPVQESQEQQHVSQQLQVVSPDETLTISKPEDFTSTSKRLDSFKKIVINSKEVRQYKVNEILKDAINVQQIVFNTSYQINRYFYNKLTLKTANQLTAIYECWDSDEFFRQRECEIYFPREQFQEDEMNRSHVEFPLWNKLKKLKTLWISNMSEFRNAQSADNTYLDIQFLKLQHCKCCEQTDYNPSEIIQWYGNGKKLRVLIVRGLKVIRQFGEKMVKCWKNSPNLSVLVIKFLSIDQAVLDRMDFKNLTNLCLKGDCNSYYSEELDVSSIFKLTQLKYLSLVRIIFAKSRKEAKTVIQGFAKLTNLTFLNLYHSYPVYSELLESLHSNLYLTLKTLNLGETHIDSACLLKLPEFEGIQQLNLDSTQISFQELSKFIDQPFLRVKCLSLSGCNGKTISANESVAIRKPIAVTARTLMIINNIFPNIQYINVANCNADIIEFEWSSMTSLQCIAVSKNILGKRKKQLKAAGVHLYEM